MRAPDTNPESWRSGTAMHKSKPMVPIMNQWRLHTAPGQDCPTQLNHESLLQCADGHQAPIVNRGAPVLPHPEQPALTHRRNQTLPIKNAYSIRMLDSICAALRGRLRRSAPEHSI